MGFKVPHFVGSLFNPIQATADAFKTTENVFKAKNASQLFGDLAQPIEGPHRSKDQTLLGSQEPFG